MALTVERIKQAKERISSYIVQTPMLRMKALDQYLGCQVYVKAECMQITGSFKLRGAVNKALTLTPEQLKCGIVAASSGNHGKGIAYAAKMLGSKATIVVPYTTTQVKVDAIRALGAEIVQCETTVRFQLAEELSRKLGATMIQSFNDEDIMAGQGTAGLEIMEQCPEVDKVIVPVSGGGLIGGVSTAIKGTAPQVKVYGAEPAALPRYSESLKAGKPVKVEQKRSIADALVAQIPGDICFPYVRDNTDGFAAVDDQYMLKGMKLLLTEGKVLCEPSSGIGMGAELQGLIPVSPEEMVCFLISGGSVGLDQLRILEEVEL